MPNCHKLLNELINGHLPARTPGHCGSPRRARPWGRLRTSFGPRKIAYSKWRACLPADTGRQDRCNVGRSMTSCTATSRREAARVMHDCSRLGILGAHGDGRPPGACPIPRVESICEGQALSRRCCSRVRKAGTTVVFEITQEGTINPELEV